MERMQATCGTCAGRGGRTFWKIVSKDEETHICTMEPETVICENCNGRGWVEYAVFSVEEAEAILKHCGLDKE